MTRVFFVFPDVPGAGVFFCTLYLLFSETWSTVYAPGGYWSLGEPPLAIGRVVTLGGDVRLDLGDQVGGRLRLPSPARAVVVVDLLRRGPGGELFDEVARPGAGVGAPDDLRHFGYQIVRAALAPGGHADLVRALGANSSPGASFAEPGISCGATRAYSAEIASP